MRLALLCVTTLLAPSGAIVALHKRVAPRPPHRPLERLRGGAMLERALSSPALGIPAMASIGFGVILPLTLYRMPYAFTVGYGLSVAAMGAALLLHFQPPPTSLAGLHATCLTVYGLRLGLHLLVRELTVPEKAAQLQSMDTSARITRVPFAASISLLYAMMSSPAIFALQRAASSSALPSSAMLATTVGVAVQWFGCVLEGVADTQKLLAKRRAAGGASSKAWLGPSGGCYTFSRHPNYAGELLFWAGTFLGGAPSFGARPVPWITGGLGLAAITSIMFGATKRLEAKQRDRYGGQPAYNAWVGKTAPLFVGSF